MLNRMKFLKLLFACAIVFGISYFYLFYYRNAFYDLTADEGYIIYGAKRVLDGQILYKDFFQFCPPGDFYLLAFVFKLFGYSFIMARETAVIIDSLINTLLFYFSYKAIRSWYAILPPLFFLILGYPNWMQYSHYWSSMLLLFISLAFFLSYLEQHKHAYLYLTGFFIGITGLFLQTTGVYSALLFLLVFILEKRKEQDFKKNLILFIISISVPLVVVFGYIGLKGALFDFIKEQYFSSRIYAETGTFNPVQLYLKYFEYPYSIVFIIFITVAVFSSIILFCFRARVSNPIKTILLGDIILFLNSSTRIDFDHMLINSAMTFIVILLPEKWFLDFLKNKYNLLHRSLRYLWDLIVILLVVWGVMSMRSNIHNVEVRTYPIDFNGTHLWTFNEKQAYEINEFFPQAEKILNGDKNVFVYPYCPLVYVLFDYKNPTFVDVTSTVSNVPDYGNYSFAMMVNELMKHKTNYIIYCNWPQHYTQMLLALNKRKYKENVLDIFIGNNYSPIIRVDNLILFKKR